jgi:sulfite exporter TauE/SafE
MFYTAFLLGLLGSFHCIGMCGPIAFMLPLNRNDKTIMIFQTFTYHIGRLYAYTLIGLMFGLLGKGLYIAGLQQNISIMIGVLMILITIMPLQAFNKLKIIKPLYSFIGKVKKKLGLYLNKKSYKALFLTGFFNGFLPCGLVYMALLGAINTSNSLQGALYMFLFGLGTVPMMTLAVFAGNFLKVSIRNKIQKIIPYVVVIIGLLFILRGLGLGIPFVSPSDAKLIISTNASDCVAP